MGLASGVEADMEEKAAVVAAVVAAATEAATEAAMAVVTEVDGLEVTGVVAMVGVSVGGAAGGRSARVGAILPSHLHRRLPR